MTDYLDHKRCLICGELVPYDEDYEAECPGCAMLEAEAERDRLDLADERAGGPWGDPDGWDAFHAGLRGIR